MNDSIVGKWRWEFSTYEFFSDGTYTYVNTNSGVRNNGNYMILGNILSFPAIGSSAQISVQGNNLIFKPIKNGVVQRGVTFSRV